MKDERVLHKLYAPKAPKESEHVKLPPERPL